jgi:hypothetical protein
MYIVTILDEKGYVIEVGQFSSAKLARIEANQWTNATVRRIR